jgi:RNA polymerase sigma factor (sigma-70 family)
MTQKSIAEVFSEYSERLLKFINSRVSNFEDSEDILQDVFYQYTNVSNIINPLENTAAWLYRVTRNKIIDHYKKKKAEQLPSHYDEDEDSYIIDEIEDIASSEEIEEIVEAALAELPNEQREVFEMTELLGFSVKEVAEKTNTPMNTVLSRKHYAVKFLRKKLEEL